MRRIAFVINGMGSGGSQREVSLYAKYFCGMGDKVFVIVLFDNRCFYPLPEEAQFVEMLGRSKKKSKNVFFWKSQLTHLFKKEQITHVVAFGTRFGILCASVVGKCKPAPALIIKEISTKPTSFFDKVCLWTFRKKISHIAAQTTIQSTISVPAFLRKKTLTIPNPFQIHATNLNTKGFKNHRVITVGRLNLPVKRQDVMIKAFSIFHEKHPDYSFDIFGAPQLNDNGKTIAELQSLIKQLDLEESVHLKGESHDIEKDTVNASLFLLASPREGMPNALVEALLLGIPAISTNWAGSSEIIEDGKNGFIVPLDDVQAMAQKMEEMFASKSNYDSMSKAAYEMATARYSEDSVYEQWSTVLLK
jgi:glycosyltransferase involved in cell wall biosynthesis